MYQYNELNVIEHTWTTDYWAERCHLLSPLGLIVAAGASWEALGLSEGLLGESWGPLGAILEPLAILLSITGLDFLSAISGAATSISNVGPGLGEMIGPNGNFSQVSDVSKWILSFGMLLGRLEIFAVLVLFLPSFWRS